MNLTVKEMPYDDVFADVVRVHLSHRPQIKAGAILKLTANGKSRPLSARGAPGSQKNYIWLDLETRSYFGVKPNQPVEFEIRKATLVDELVWAYRASNPAYRIAARLSITSVFLGLIGLVLGLIGLALGWSDTQTPS